MSALLIFYVKRASGIYRSHRFIEGSLHTLCGVRISSFSVIHWGLKPVGTIVPCERCHRREQKLRPLLEGEANRA